MSGAILVIDDNAVDREAIRRHLRADHAIAEAATAGDGLVALDRGTFDCVLLDHRLPDRAGIELLDAIAERGVPVVMLTGQGTEALAVEAMKRGASDYLVKDRLDRHTLLRAIRGAVERAALRRQLEAKRETLARTVADLGEREARLRVVLEQLPAMVWTYDAELRCSTMSGAALATTGITREECLGRPITEVAAIFGAGPELVEAHRAALAGISGHYDLVFATRTWRCHVEPLTGPATPGVVGVALDVSDARALQELRLASVRLQAESMQAREASRLKSAFLANMSHELRTPLNAVIGFAELLHDEVVDARSPEGRQLLAEVVSSGRHLLQLINDVLDLSKIEAGRLDFSPEPVDCGLVVAESVAIVRGMAASRDIAIDVEIAPTVTDLVLDGGRLRQILCNFLSNAVKFTPDGGRVVVRVAPEPDDTMFRIEVHDTGCGIAEADIGRLFVEFQQLDSGTTKRHPGTGLGLALTRRLVEAQGGTVGVRSRLGQGSTFYAILPRVHAAAPAPAPAPAPAAASASAAAAAAAPGDGDRG